MTDVTPLVDVGIVADYLLVTPTWVYEHAAELGAYRLGSGPKARLRFSFAKVDEYLSACSAGRRSDEPKPTRQAVSRSRRRPTSGTSVELLPIRGRISRTNDISGRAA